MRTEVRVLLATSFALLTACGLQAVGLLVVDEDGGGGGADGGGADVIPVDAGDGATEDGGDSGGEAEFLPSYFDAALVAVDAGDLFGPATIDTSALTIDGNASVPGISFSAIDGGAKGVAVLSVGAFVVNRALTISGQRALVVLASSDVRVGAPILADAKRTAPGPGGHASGAGPGAGGPGAAGSGYANSGGGGAGHGAQGGDGGVASSTPGGMGGPGYETALLGGSGGGRGDPTACFVPGGAGGGAIQIFSRKRIDVADGGAVSASGGGGAGGCAQWIGSSGAGGGSGGFILLEAPSVTVRGVVAANGGGGGGADIYNGTDATPGEDGKRSTARAIGGTGAQSTGGFGGSADGPATSGGSANNAAGGGGAAGRIFVRVRPARFDADGGTFSPPPTVDAGP